MIVFEGSRPADMAENRALATLERRHAPLIWLGAPVAIKEHASVCLRRQSGSNLLIVGQREDLALNLMTAALINPARQKQFEVLVLPNLYGDILTDEASMLAGSLGMLPSASLGDSTRGLYEPIHGSAPDIAGQGIANPCAAIASVALLLRHSLGLEKEAAAVETAIGDAIAAGARTADIATADDTTLSTNEMSDEIIRCLS